MDFFENQERARRRTGWLVFFFALAVLGTVLALYVIVSLVVDANTSYAPNEHRVLWRLDLFLATLVGVLFVVGSGSMYKMSQLRGGGQAVAEMLGGRPVPQNASDQGERRLLNVVEEMAIAAGTSVPRVYLLETERGINAFAAGRTIDDAVIGVTRGCVDELSRDELQGVVAHEFSHILNGDMRLNIRLMGVVHGILVIGLIGWFILRTMHGGRRNPLPLLGIAICVIGYVGTFFGNLIKAAVSRQREFLADAAAVQFTRNPDGIAGALAKIGGYSRGGRLHAHRAAEVSHMLFERGTRRTFDDWFATHPPLDERIRRIDGQRPHYAKSAPPLPTTTAGGGAASSLAGAAPPPVPARAKKARPTALETVGQLLPEHVTYARRLMKGIPASARQAAAEPFGARALVYALLLNEEEEPRRKQLAHLEAQGDDAVYRETRFLQPAVDDLDEQARLPLLDLALPALRELSPGQRTAFLHDVEVLIEADRRLDVFEWVLGRILLRHLPVTPDADGSERGGAKSLTRLTEPCAVLLSSLAYAGHRRVEDARHAYQRGIERLTVLPGMKPVAECGLREMQHALHALAAARPAAKRRVLSACATTISADGEVTVKEGELFRAVADSLDCPVPPLLPGQPLA